MAASVGDAMVVFAASLLVCAFIAGAVGFAYLECYWLSALTLGLMACVRIKWSDSDKKSDEKKEDG